MPLKVFASIIGAVLLAGAATAWAISLVPSTLAVSMIIIALIGLKFSLMRGSS